MQREIGATDSVSGLNFNDMTKSLLDFDICTVVIFPCAYFLWEVPLLIILPIELDLLSGPALALTALRLINWARQQCARLTSPSTQLAYFSSKVGVGVNKSLLVFKLAGLEFLVCRHVSVSLLGLNRSC
ncbi:hypothetical protein COCCADRAFT_108764 [Bipolaris zeicola 26-R-13]|uniref:Uncharacterized protein n=1 Tax=Cochliobolus carbonum (strain 26-R-13) TaxID=930089 RepID=W6XTA6_COCC2|nr:uncharacterized protein COCCADRAFT_108764 [Bipolaris zeicola 26-R-13]EUC28575.1 hypothetical protein COCCADRAFT_108764 [Bipolaris zeicola 26-R-13]